METVQLEGKRNIKREVEFYNFDMIIAVGYRVNDIKSLFDEYETLIKK